MHKRLSAGQVVIAFGYLKSSARFRSTDNLEVCFYGRDRKIQAGTVEGLILAYLF